MKLTPIGGYCMYTWAGTVQSQKQHAVIPSNHLALEISPGGISPSRLIHYTILTGSEPVKITALPGILPHAHPLHSIDWSRVTSWDLNTTCVSRVSLAAAYHPFTLCNIALWVRIWLAPLNTALYHTSFISGKRCKWWSHRPKWFRQWFQMINLSVTSLHLNVLIGIELLCGWCCDWL